MCRRSHKNIIKIILATILAALSLFSCAAPKTAEVGVLSAETKLFGSRLYHAAKISLLFQYASVDSSGGGTDAVTPVIPCAVAGCAHSDDSCPAFIRGLTCWAPQVGEDGDLLWYAQMRSYVDAETHTGARHNVIARLDVATGATDTLLQDWEYPISQLLLYGGEIYFLSKNAGGLRDVWVMPQSGGKPALYIQNDGADIAMLGMENGVLFLQTEDGGVFRADTDGGTVTLTRLFVCDYKVGVYVSGGYIYYPAKNPDAPEYEYLPGRVEHDNATGEAMEVAVAVNSRNYYRVSADGGAPEPVVSGVQATSGGLCEGGVLYLPVWDFKYYGSIESDGAYADYFSRTQGAVAAVRLNNLKVSLIKTGGLDFSAIYAVTDNYIIGRASNPLAAYEDGAGTAENYVIYDRSDGSARTVDFN